MSEAQGLLQEELARQVGLPGLRIQEEPGGPSPYACPRPAVECSPFSNEHAVPTSPTCIRMLHGRFVLCSFYGMYQGLQQR